VREVRLSQENEYIMDKLGIIFPCNVYSTTSDKISQVFVFNICSFCTVLSFTCCCDP
jgi:hypothetical protein